MNRTILLDRDGVINFDIGYVNTVSKLKLLPQTKKAIQIFNENNIDIHIITNQSGINRGVYSIQEYKNVENRLRNLLIPQFVNDIYYCPHLSEEKCECRKPKPFMILQAQKKWNFNLSHTFFVGDKISDIDCAINANVNPILVLTGYGKNTLKYIKNKKEYNNVLIFKNLYAVANWLIAMK